MIYRSLNDYQTFVCSPVFVKMNKRMNGNIFRCKKWEKLTLVSFFFQVSPIVVSQNFSSATSDARLAPISTETGIFNSWAIMWDISSIPPPSRLSKPLNKKKKINLMMDLIIQRSWSHLDKRQTNCSRFYLAKKSAAYSAYKLMRNNEYQDISFTGCLENVRHSNLRFLNQSESEIQRYNTNLVD